jgi:biotin carboxyl carrier protein
MNAPASVLLEVDGQRRRVELGSDRGDEPSAGAVLDGDTLHVDVDGRSVPIRLAPPPTVDAAARAAGVEGAPAVLVAPMPGTVVAIGASVGDALEAGARLVVIEAMKMEHVVVAPVAGTLAAVHVGVGQRVGRGDPLAEVAAYDAGDD